MNYRDADSNLETVKDRQENRSTNTKEGLKELLVRWRRDLHQHPELSFQEFKTSAYIVRELNKINNIQIKKRVGTPNGVVATVSSGTGPVIALRADMDALPIVEETKHEFVSKNKGVMHACGHDAHTSILLGTVHLISKQFAEGKLRGTVKFIFQPAEEDMDEHGLTGAPYMVESGVLDDVQAVLALHVSPWLPVGEIQINDGYSMASVDTFEATIHGFGGHGAYPYLTKDPIWMLGSVLQAFYGVVSRRVSPLDPVAASIGKVATGTASNVIPTEVKINGTLRSFSPDARRKLAEEVEQVFKIVQSFGGTYDFKLHKGEPPLKNDSQINKLLEDSVHHMHKTIKVHRGPFGMVGEDFAHMTEKVPGALFFLGCSLNDGIERDLHTSIFDIDENCLELGVEILSETVKRLLNKTS
ncbi:M20 metallopeptidase family protein [Virgibacillus sp. W0430]|uniref:M20 metallopeptidase family protein n=1 Tax=Virgibacillus sp. W0430 TaxID=3391580 RepID=UPI003F4675AD